MKSPTFDETYDSLIRVATEAQRGLYRLGQIRGRNDLQSEKELRFFIVATSKLILNQLPCLQLECDAIEHEDSRYGAILTRLENATGDDDEGASALSCQDQADKGLCGDCLEPCDFREGEE
jgi:hypothetical protein